MPLKIMLLGGSPQQIIAIKKAKELGFITILCDYLPDNPGQYVADKFYQTSTTDKYEVLEVAKSESIDGILSYASDPAAPIAAFVANELGLPGNPYKSVEILGYKDLFRRYLTENGFQSPISYMVENYDDCLTNAEKLSFPLMVKPVDSAGSKGVTKVGSMEGLQRAFDYAMAYSKSCKIIMETYIVQEHKHMISGDCFVIGGKIVFWGFLNGHKCLKVNPFVPTGTSYPLDDYQDRIDEVKNQIQRLISDLDIEFGGFNIEVIISKEGKINIIELGPRNGGNMIPDFLYRLSGFDMIEASIKCALGLPYDYRIKVGYGTEDDTYMAACVLHASQSGVFQGVDLSLIKDEVREVFLYSQKGDVIELGNLTHYTLGIIFLEFASKTDMHRIVDHLHDYVRINIK